MNLVRTLYPCSARSALGRGSGGGLALTRESISQPEDADRGIAAGPLGQWCQFHCWSSCPARTENEDQQAAKHASKDRVTSLELRIRKAKAEAQAEAKTGSPKP